MTLNILPVVTQDDLRRFVARDRNLVFKENRSK